MVTSILPVRCEEVEEPVQKTEFGEIARVAVPFPT
jgi:pyruvoyl-dependent arginine decarboxylase (PvlArgDC)